MGYKALEGGGGRRLTYDSGSHRNADYTIPVVTETVGCRDLLRYLCLWVSGEGETGRSMFMYLERYSSIVCRKYNSVTLRPYGDNFSITVELMLTFNLINC